MGFGDELMVSGHARVLQQSDPRKVRLIYERATHWSEVFDHNPRIARIGERGDFQEFPARVAGLRPYIRAKSESKWTWQDYKPLPGELYFTEVERYHAEQARPADVVVAPSIKNKASPNKDWGWERWQALVTLMNEAGIRVTHLGPPGTKPIHGAPSIQLQSFREAAAYLARARAAVLPEGGLHHAAAAVGVRAVVIFGGYISPAQTGYDTHVNLFTGGAPCGMRVQCSHCREAMEAITPKAVLEQLMTLIK